MSEVSSPIVYDVDSNVIAKLTYDDKTSQLFVAFHSGREYMYSDVPQTVFEDMISETDSVGRFYNKNIVGKYEHREMTKVAKAKR